MSQHATVSNQILTTLQTRQKIRRIAYEIYEQNFQEPIVFLAGIEGMGYQLAAFIKDELEKIAAIQVQLIKVMVDKAFPIQGKIGLSCEIETIKNQVVIMVDDVLNTGRTLAYCLEPFLSVHLRRLQVAVLVDRSHRSFPISPDFSGYQLSTTVNEHIEVVLDSDERFGVYLY